ncbi:MAG: hypothetical protein CMG35_07285 [Candidatus Marinimicrobia bacterium]|nr:hypothetical protein [Candidatus Neomarinimicrobiota bacterium]
MLLFVKRALKEISPTKNFKSLTTNIQGDILAGITVGIIALPLALAFGEISQLGPIAGVWGAIVGGIIGGLFGGCMVGISGPTAPKAAQIAAFMSFFVIGTTNEPDLTAAFSIIFISGLILVILSLLNVSRFIHYTPYSVIAGFMCGIGLIVILTQMNAFIGLEVEKNIHDVFNNLGSSLANVNIEALVVSVPSLLILFLWPFLEKSSKYLTKIPSPLVALIIGTTIAHSFKLDIPFIGDKILNASGQNIFSFYIPDFSRLKDFFGPALALAGLAVLDSLLSCKVADNMIGDRHSSDRETFGQGMANMAAGLVGGVTTATATMRTVANIKFGGKTPLSSIVHGLTLLAILLGLSSFVAAIPAACLAAILFKVGIDIMDYRILPVIRKIPKTDLLIFCVVLFITVYEDLMVAIAIGICIAIIANFKQFKSSLPLSNQYSSKTFAHSNFSKKDNKFASTNEDLVQIFDIRGPVFFGSVESLLRAYSALPAHKILLMDIRKITSLDITGAYALEDLIHQLRKKGISTYVICTQVKIKTTLKNLNIIENMGSDRYLNSPNKALPAIEQELSQFQ